MRRHATKSIKSDVIERQSVLENKTKYNEIDFTQIFGVEKSWLKELCSVITNAAREGDVETMINNIAEFTDIIYTRLNAIHYSKKHVEFILELLVKQGLAEILLKLFDDGEGEELSYIALDFIAKLAMVDSTVATLFITPSLVEFLFSAPEIMLQFIKLVTTILPNILDEMSSAFSIFPKLCDILPQIPPIDALNVWIAVVSHDLSNEQISTIISLLPKCSDPECLYRIMRVCEILIEKNQACIPQLIEEEYLPAVCSLWGNPGLKIHNLRFWEMIVSKDENAKILILENDMFPAIMDAVDSDDMEEAIIGVRFVNNLLPECLEILLSDDYFDLVFAILYAAITIDSCYAFKLECAKLLTNLIYLDTTFAEALMLRDFCKVCENVFGSDDETLTECFCRIFEFVISEVEKTPEYRERFQQYWSESSLSTEIVEGADERIDALMERVMELL